MPIPARDSKDLRIARANPNKIVPSFTNDFTVSHNESGFFITFSVIEPPIFLSDDELEKISEVQAVALSKYFVEPRFAKRLVQAFQDNIGKFEGRFGEIKEP